MRITVMCGAGASSTFVAQRLRSAIAARGVEATARAAGLASYPDCLDGTDVLLIGPHLADRLDAVRRDASTRGTRVAVLPDDIFGDRDGERAYALAVSVAGPGTTDDERNPR